MNGYLIDVQSLIRSFYILGAVSILTARLIPLTRERYLSYGARNDQKEQLSNEGSIKSEVQPAPFSRKYDGTIVRYLDVKVPHSWFIHFYFVSVCSSFYWLYQCTTHGLIFDFVAKNTNSKNYCSSPQQLALCWSCLLFQGSRRLYECLIYSKESNSRMWIGHYAIGIAFYLVSNIAIWIDHVVTIQSTSFKSFSWIENDWRSKYYDMACVALFLFASKYQHDCHRYLASLKRYTLPDQWQFKSIISPHYTAECMIYLSLALLGAPQGEYVNATLFCALIFVATNLGITADSTKSWMKEKFGNRSEEIDQRWKMIPGIW